ncbi:allophanate hydrolase [Sporolactobacillus sp. THM7-7]|nr:allophanate hydrolase [Sporolactobacillus sp. THM7-7]
MHAINLPKKLTIKYLKEEYKADRLTPEWLIHDIIKRAEENKDFNIWITPPSLKLINPYLERLRTMDPRNKPLWGIPFAIKDNIDLAGIETTAGCPEFAYKPKENATVINRLLEAGAIPIGKTNLDQFATGLVGMRSPYGETKNALNQELISGGSSSGSAVSVARGLAAFSLGTDTAGSGRVPAALNRLIGYKPSRGAWPVHGVVPACSSLDCVSVFANNLEDALIVDHTVRGFEERDPWSRKIQRMPNRLPERICLVKDPLNFFGPFAEEYKKAWGTAVKRMKNLNIPIEFIDGSYLSKASSILYDGPWIAERWSDLGSFINANKNAAFPITETVLKSSLNSKYNAVCVFKAIHRLQLYKRKALKQLKNGVLIMPTTGGTWTRAEVRKRPISTNNQMGLYTNHCNLLDLCAVNIPSDDAAKQLPFGITLFSSYKNEHLISGLAELFLNGRS